MDTSLADVLDTIKDVDPAWGECGVSSQRGFWRDRTWNRCHFEFDLAVDEVAIYLKEVGHLMTRDTRQQLIDALQAKFAQLPEMAEDEQTTIDRKAYASVLKALRAPLPSGRDDRQGVPRHLLYVTA